MGSPREVSAEPTHIAKQKPASAQRLCVEPPQLSDRSQLDGLLPRKFSDISLHLRDLL
jgi:hypothetical protein